MLLLFLFKGLFDFIFISFKLLILFIPFFILFCFWILIISSAKALNSLEKSEDDEDDIRLKLFFKILFSV